MATIKPNPDFDGEELAKVFVVIVCVCVCVCVGGGKEGHNKTMCMCAWVKETNSGRCVA